MTVGVADWRGKGGAFVFSLPREAVIVNIGTGAPVVCVGNGVEEGTTEERGVLNCASNEVFVGDGRDGAVDVELGTLVGGREVGVVKEGRGVLVGGCKR